MNIHPSIRLVPNLQVGNVETFRLYADRPHIPPAWVLFEKGEFPDKYLRVCLVELF